MISGDGHQIEAILKRLSHEGIKSKDLPVSHAFHSPLMDPVLRRVRKGRLERRVFRTDRGICFQSDWRARGCALDRARRLLASPRARAGAVRCGGQDASGTRVLKFSWKSDPIPVLLGMARRCLKEERQSWLPSLRSGRGDWLQMLESLQELYVAGAEIDWARFDQ